MSKRIICAAILTTALAAGSVWGQAIPDRELVIGTKQTVPFVIQNPDGTWQGISIELWQDITEKLGLRYRFVERDLEGLLDGLEDTTLDAVAAALTVTSERESEVDFSHPFYTTGLTIAVPATGQSGWLGMLKRVFSTEFLTAIGALLLLLVIVGMVAWMFERRKNPDEFGGSIIEGIGAGLWWSAVTMTTVGYGDKAPRTLPGRIVGLIWMFAAIIVVSGFTATIASSLTVSQLESAVKGPKDLPYVEVGSIPNSTSAAYLEAKGVSFSGFETPLHGLKALARGEIEAFVYDAPILRYLVKTELSDRVRVLPVTFFRQDYAIALPQDSQLREPVNRALLEEVQSAEWDAILERYLGED